MAMSDSKELAKLCMERWSRVTGDGSRWGNDAFILEPIAELAGEPLRPEEQASARRAASALSPEAHQSWHGDGHDGHDELVAALRRERDEARAIAAQWHEAAGNGEGYHYMTGLWQGGSESKAEYKRHGEVIATWK